jgi:hypothetical protein
MGPGLRPHAAYDPVDGRFFTGREPTTDDRSAEGSGAPTAPPGAEA